MKRSLSVADSRPGETNRDNRRAGMVTVERACVDQCPERDPPLVVSLPETYQSPAERIQASRGAWSEEFTRRPISPCPQELAPMHPTIPTSPRTSILAIDLGKYQSAAWNPQRSAFPFQAKRGQGLRQEAQERGKRWTEPLGNLSSEPYG